VATLAATGGPATPWPLLPALLVLGIGMGASMAPYFDIVLAAVDEHEVGSAAGTLTAAQQVGGAIGVAVLGTTFFSWLGHDASAAGTGGFTTSLERVLWLEIALLALAGGLCFLLPPRAREDAPPADAANTEHAATGGTDGAYAATVAG
jgi:hypothetical protein